MIVRRADDRGDWRAAGCSSSAQWLAQISSSDYRTAARITRTSDALRKLPALDEAMSSGELTLDQVAAAAPVATPETDAELARIAVGKAPSQIARAARTLTPPVVADDQALYRRRAWHDPDDARRELAFERLACRSSRASRSSRRSGTSPSRSAPSTRKTGGPAPSGASTPQTRSSRSPPSRARRRCQCAA